MEVALNLSQESFEEKKKAVTHCFVCKELERCEGGGESADECRETQTHRKKKSWIA